MATPAKSVQFREAADLVEFYKGEEIAAFGIRQANALCFKYQGDDLEEGTAKLTGILSMMLNNKTAAIYTLCLYSRFEDEITEKTPCSLSVNFRLNEYGESIGGFSPGGGSESSKKIRELEDRIKQLEGEKEPDNRLGLIGELMEMDAVQPIVLAIAGKIADFISGIGNQPSSPGSQNNNVGELKRVSGVPGWHGVWKDDPEIVRSIDTLADKLEDFPEIMAKLARIALNSPVKFNLFVHGLRRMSA